MPSKKAEKTLNLAAVLDLNEASTLRSKLMGLRGSNVAIDASGVERLGTLCVQVLLSAAKTWNEDNYPSPSRRYRRRFRKRCR